MARPYPGQVMIEVSVPASVASVLRAEAKRITGVTASAVASKVLREWAADKMKAVVERESGHEPGA
jgi:hypothetical protein